MLTGMRTAEGKMNNRVLIISKIGFPLAFSYMSGARGIIVGEIENLKLIGRGPSAIVTGSERGLSRWNGSRRGERQRTNTGENKLPILKVRIALSRPKVVLPKPRRPVTSRRLRLEEAETAARIASQMNISLQGTISVLRGTQGSQPR